MDDDQHRGQQLVMAQRTRDCRILSPKWNILYHISLPGLRGHGRRKGRKTVIARGVVIPCNDYKQTVSKHARAAAHVNSWKLWQHVCKRLIQRQGRQNSNPKRAVEHKVISIAKGFWKLIARKTGRAFFKSMAPGKVTIFHWKVTQIKVEEHEVGWVGMEYRFGKSWGRDT